MGILAIDAGTTGVTALIVDETGQVTSTGYQEFPQHFPGDGLVEHELSEIWQAVLGAVSQAREGAPGETIVAVGITNQRETLCLWDRETLGAARRAIVWQDRRTSDLCESYQDQGLASLIHERTGLRLDPYFTATKLAWVRINEPHIWAGIESGRTAVGTVDSYLIARMTRGLHHVTDATNASRTMLFNINEGQWDAKLLEAFGVPLHCLPDIVTSYGIIANTDPRAFLGLDIPISGIAGDQQAALVGQGCLTEGTAKCTYGTGAFLLAHTGTVPKFSDSGLLTTVALGHPDGSLTYALEGSVFVAGSAVQWLRDQLGIITTAAESEQLAESVHDSGGIAFVPALTGLGVPDWDPYARGLIIGIGRGTTRSHIARATLEGIAFLVTDVVRLMQASAQSDPAHELRSLSIDGGAAANDLLCQIQADALGLAIDRNAALQCTGIGAAYLAGVGVGTWRSLEDLKGLRRSDQVFSPKASLAATYAKWLHAKEFSLGWARD